MAFISSLSFTGEAFPSGKVGRPSNHAGQSKKWLLFRLSGLLKLVSDNSSFGNTRLASGLGKPLGEIPRDPNGDCITHLLQS
jgi:hypothetical protein